LLTSGIFATYTRSPNCTLQVVLLTFYKKWVGLQFWAIFSQTHLGPMLWFFKYFRRKKIAKMAILSPNKAELHMQNFDHNIGFWEKSQFFCRKLAKIAENCDRNIDPWAIHRNWLKSNGENSFETLTLNAYSNSLEQFHAWRGFESLSGRKVLGLTTLQWCCSKREAFICIAI
jgi:hypothetical protein